MNTQLTETLIALYKLDPPNIHYLCHTLRTSPNNPCRFYCDSCPLIKTKIKPAYYYIARMVSLEELL